MADAYWRYTDPRQPSAMASVVGKRSRTEFDLAGSQNLSAYYAAGGDRGTGLPIRDVNTSYDQYMPQMQAPSYGAGQSAVSLNEGMVRHPIEDPRLAGMGSFNPEAVAQDRSVRMGTGRSEVPLPTDASNTLFVEGLPADCRRREVAHIFRPFVGYKEVRLVSKESRQPRGDPLVLCFVDFVSPAHASTAMEALQGYQFDEQDRNSAILRLQFARFPGARSGGRRGKR